MFQGENGAGIGKSGIWRGLEKYSTFFQKMFKRSSYFCCLARIWKDRPKSFYGFGQGFGRNGQGDPASLSRSRLETTLEIFWKLNRILNPNWTFI